MKKLFVILIAVVFSAANVFAQTDQQKPVVKKEMKTEKKPLHYVMMNGAMSECWGEKGTPMTKEATLKNGDMVSTKGEVTMKDGKKVMLKEGECINLNGKIMMHDKAHAMMKEKMKKEEPKKTDKM